MQVFRVQSSSDAFFNLQLTALKIQNQTTLISNGAPQDYNTYVATNVKVYLVQGNAVGNLVSTLQFSSPTKNTFIRLGNLEIFI
ncbi:TPA: hypothetical protein U5D84_000391 [Yersinia enterocolitica]|nr:hypothetical protein [Yersinia enterocolitica]